MLYVVIGYAVNPAIRTGRTGQLRRRRHEVGPRTPASQANERGGWRTDDFATEQATVRLDQEEVFGRLPLERDGGEREPPDPGCRCPSTWSVTLYDLSIAQELRGSSTEGENSSRLGSLASCLGRRRIADLLSFRVLRCPQTPGEDVSTAMTLRDSTGSR